MPTDLFTPEERTAMYEWMCDAAIPPSEPSKYWRLLFGYRLLWWPKTTRFQVRVLPVGFRFVWSFKQLILAKVIHG